MIPILYPNNYTSFETRGYGAVTTCTYCQISETLNGEYELEMRCFYNDPLSSYLLPRNILLVKANQTQQPQAFRIYKITRPLNNVMTVYARHISYDLSGYTVLPYSTRQGISGAITYLQSNAGNFTISTDKTSGSKWFRIGVPSSVRSWFGGQEGSLIDLFGGEWQYDLFDCQLLEERGEDKGVRINYGVNLAAYQKERSDNVYSGVLAYYCKDVNGVVTRVIGTEAPTGLTAVQRTLILDVTGEYEDDTIPTAAQLTAVAQSYVTANRTALTSDVQTIMVTPELIGTQNVEMGDTVHVIYGAEKLDLRVVKTVWDALAERYTSLELGAKKASIAQTIQSVSGRSSSSSSNVVVDTALSDTSNNPVQNRIITAALTEKLANNETITQTGTVTPSTAWKQTNLHYSIPQAGWYLIEGREVYSNAQPVGVVIGRRQTDANCHIAAISEKGSWTYTAGTIRATACGYFAAGDDIYLFTKEEAATGTNSIALRVTFLK